MKKFFWATVTLLVFIACKRDAKNTMTVTGNVKGLKKGTLYLQHIPDSILVTLDSLQIAGDGKFTFKTELQSPEIFYLYLNKEDANDINDRLVFFGEPGTITVHTAWNAFDTQAKISGSESHKKLEEYRKVMSKFNVEELDIARALFDPKFSQNPVALDSIQKLGDRNYLRSYLYALNFALNNKNSFIAPYIALYEVSDANVMYLDSIHKSLSLEVADSKYGKALKKLLEEKRGSE